MFLHLLIINILNVVKILLTLVNIMMFFSNLISEKLHENWSPEQISNALLNDKLSFKTIYNWIYIGKLKGISLLQLDQKCKK